MEQKEDDVVVEDVKDGDEDVDDDDNDDDNVDGIIYFHDLVHSVDVLLNNVMYYRLCVINDYRLLILYKVLWLCCCDLCCI